MASDAARSHEGAVGSKTHESWLKIGQMQFGYLDAGNYYGVGISPDILLAATDTVARYGLQAKLPRLTPVRDMRLALLPDRYFTVPPGTACGPASWTTGNDSPTSSRSSG
jgi:hypothetical protein